ncbi:MAG TPA: hypothetical protein VIU02_01500 [Burkholderiales bacterium]
MNRQFIVRDSVFLRSRSRRGVELCMGGLTYVSGDIVPDGLLARQEQPVGSTAGYFVSQVMRHRFGENPARWPELAVEFCKDAKQ